MILNFQLVKMLQRFAFIFVLLLFVPDIYIYWGYIERRVKSKGLRLLFWFPTLALIAAFVLLMYIGSANPLSERSDAIGWLSILMMAFGFPKFFFMLFGLVGDLCRFIIRLFTSSFNSQSSILNPQSTTHRVFTIAGSIVALCSFCMILYARIEGIRHFVVKEVTLQIPNLPQSFEGYRMLQLSDIHSGSFRGMPDVLQELVERVNEQQADVIFFTGDLVNQRSSELEQFKQILSGFRAKDGVYSILGNHDYGRYYRWQGENDEARDTDRLYDLQRQMGWKMLRNEHDILHHSTDSIAIIGVENEGRPPFPQVGDLPLAMKGTEDMTKILLSHDPTHWQKEVIPDTDIALTLSGHTHAAQFILFGWSPAQYIYKEWDGLYKEGNQQLYVNVGIGFVGLPFRFGAWPEITVFTLHKGAVE